MLWVAAWATAAEGALTMPGRVVVARGGQQPGAVAPLSHGEHRAAGRRVKEHELREFFLERFGKTTARENRKRAFVVYGASGYTGKLILEYIYQHVKGLGTDITFALAGRTPAKLHARLDEIKQKFPDVAYVPDVLRADIADAMDVEAPP